MPAAALLLNYDGSRAMNPLSSSKTTSSRRRSLGIAIAAGCALVLLVAFLGIRFSQHAQPSSAQQSPSSAANAPASPPATARAICGRPILNSPYNYDGTAGPFSSGTAGLPTYGRPGSDFPNDNAGDVLSAQTASYQNYQLHPDTVYYLEPGVHIGSFAADTNDAFVGGYSGGTRTTLSGNYAGYPWAIASLSAEGVAVEYLTIEKYQPVVNQVAINQGGDTEWTIQYNTITLNVPGGGAFVATNGIIRDNCMTLNGQYGFQSAAAQSMDSLTKGPYNITIEDNEISYNDTCDLSGLMNNPAIGWHNYNPVPAEYRNPKCGKVIGDGDQGGFKLWQTDGVTVKDNYIHNNWGPGGWADTNNANTTWTGNTITDNESVAIVEEISYNFSISGNYIADNDWVDGLNNPRFPQAAIYISESGSDTMFGGVPACAEAACAHQDSYPTQSIIRGNKVVDNGGSIFLWQDSNRYCGDGFDGVCTLVDGGSSSPFTISSCKANIRSASVDTTTYVGNKTGSPLENWWDGCMWKTENVRVTQNTIEFDPADIMDCNRTAWPDCGAGGIFSEYGGPAGPGEWAIPTDLTFFQNDVWSGNVYNGPSTFFAWNQGNGDNPVSWADWTGNVAHGNKCSSPSDRQSGYCTGPFGQDAGSTYNSSRPPTTPASS
jgi:Right handed beta helix region